MALIESPRRSVEIPMSSEEYGPWLGSMRSVSADQVPPGYVTAIDATTPSNNFLYLPRSGTWKLRGGASEVFDTFASEVGLLPAKWSSRIRQLEEFLSDSIGDGIPTLVALLTKETLTDSANLDDGFFSNLWLRDQVAGTNYTLGDEYSTASTYPVPGAVQTYRITPVWYESGDGGITRGVTEFARRFFCSGSRRFLQVGNELYMPNVKGTPWRWRKKFAASGALAGTNTTSTVDAGAWLTQAAGTDLHTVIDETVANDADYMEVRLDSGGGGQVSAQIGIATPSPLPDSDTPHVLEFRYRRVAGAVTTHDLNAVFYKGGDTVTIKSISIADVPISTTWINYSVTLSAAEVASLADTGTGGGAYNSMRVYFNWAGAFDGAIEGPKFQVSWFRLSFGESLTQANLNANANYLFPTGPFPPTHAGSISATAAVTPVYMRPNADVADGSWVNSAGNQTDLYTYIDETTADDTTTFIKSDTSNTTCDIGLATPSTPPATGDSVTLRYRVSAIVLGSVNLSVSVMLGTTAHATANHAFTTSQGYTDYSLSVPDSAVDSITASDADWSDVFLRFTSSNEAGLENVLITQAFIEILPAGLDSEGGWKGKDRFFRAIAYRFEDDSIWLPTDPRFPNATLASGLDLVTVDSSNPDVSYTSITHSNLPIPPHDVKSLLLLRGDKIDSSVDDNLLLNPTGLKLIDEVPAGTTEYVDYKGDDAALTLDVEEYFIRYDHMMAPRSRYLFGGDMRVCASYGGQSPVAITIAPVGRLADWDLNVADTNEALYGVGTSDASYMRLDLSAAGVMTLTLARDDGTTLTSDTYASSTYSTLQELVDAVNATSVASTPDSGQWRAQLCARRTGDILMTDLCPHSRVISSCLVTSQAITRQAGGLSKVAVGALVDGTGVTAGAYITEVVSDTELTFSGTITAATVDLTFYFDLGNSPSGTPLGYQRVIGNCLPGFLYFNKTFLDTQTFDKSATWMTVASPGSVKSAPNCWSVETANRFIPPLDSGICQGGGAVGESASQGFVVLYAKGVGVILPRGPDSILDQDYGLRMLDETRGCCAWNTIAAGPRFVSFMGPEGIFAADLSDIRLISEAIYVDQPTALGDFSYEGPASVAATAQDNDASYAWARILRGVLWVGYRPSGTAVTRRVRFDFSSGDESAGIRALYRKPGLPWGWSTPLTGTYGLMGEGRRSDGIHLYGWDQTNGGSTGDGRLDEVETGTTDNGTAITGRVEMPWLRPPEGGLISGQEFILEHNSPTGSTGSLVYHRTFANDAYTLTPGTSSLGVYSEMKMLPFHNARANANACFVDYRQATGAARELRKLVLKFKVVKRFK